MLKLLNVFLFANNNFCLLKFKTIAPNKQLKTLKTLRYIKFGLVTYNCKYLCHSKYGRHQQNDGQNTMAKIECK